MVAYDLTNIIQKVCRTMETHCIAPGNYCRWLWKNEEYFGPYQELGSNPYGCADAANILYTLGMIPQDAQTREAFVTTLQGFQKEDNGEFHEKTHARMHSTAHCTAALELFEARPRYPLTFADSYKTKEGLYQLLDSLEWYENPWSTSHKGAGVFAALTLAGEVTPEWRQWYFDWLNNEFDPKTGLLRKGFVDRPGTAPAWQHMAGTFHYLFNYENEKMPLPYPERLVDSCLEMYYAHEIPEFGLQCGFLEIDWVYCLNRASRQSGYHTKETKQAISTFAKTFYEFLNEVDEKTDMKFNDLHMLFGSMCALAEIQQSVYGIYRSPRPLRLVLDRRPFI